MYNQTYGVVTILLWFFCCDCGGGCRTRSGAGASTGVSAALSKLDKDSSGDLDLKEFDDRVSVKEFNTASKPKSNYLTFWIVTIKFW